MTPSLTSPHLAARPLDPVVQLPGMEICESRKKDRLAGMIEDFQLQLD